MISEKIPNKSAFGGKGFQLPIGYVARDDDQGEGKEKPVLMGVANLDVDIDTPEDRRIAWEVMNMTAQRAQRLRSNPISHWVISWREGEHPDAPQIREVVQTTLATLGMSDRQAFWAFHQDTDNDHLHLIINRALDGQVAKEPRRDYLLVDRAMRALEIQQGWAHDNGPWTVREGRDGQKQVVRMSRQERSALGLLKDGQPTQAARHARHHQGAPSFQEWVASSPAQSLVETLQRPGAAWDDVHATLAQYGVRIEAKHQGPKSGLVLTSSLGTRTLSAKASQMGRWAGRAQLEARLGPFSASGDVTKLPSARESYGQFLTRFQRGQEGAWERRDGPAQKSYQRSYRSDPDFVVQREQRRAARAQARAELYERFRSEQERGRKEKRAAREALQKRHQAERAALRDQLRELRLASVQGLYGVDAKLALSLYAFEAAKQREELQKRQAAERTGMCNPTLKKAQLWRDWLELQAEAGDPTAQSALRGIRYRERRNQIQSQNGIEGEELAAFEPVLGTLQADIDRRGQRIIYRDALGRAIFTDTGPRIDVHEHTDEQLEAALRLAAQKYGGKIDITGSGAFRERAARMAAHLGIEVLDGDLAQVVADEQEKIRQVHTKDDLELKNRSGIKSHGDRHRGDPEVQPSDEVDLE